MTSNLAVRWIVERLEQAGFAYMLTGSFASSYWGKPRGTQALDIVVAPTADQLQALLEVLAQDDCYVDNESARSAFRRKAQFNVLDVRTGWKIDLIFRKQRLFSETEMNRAQLVEVDGTRLLLASPEDVVIAKLEWAKQGGSSRQLDDAAGVVESLGERFDMDYVDGWARRLGIEAGWREIRGRLNER